MWLIDLTDIARHVFGYVQKIICKSSLHNEINNIRYLFVSMLLFYFYNEIINNMLLIQYKLYLITIKI